MICWCEFSICLHIKFSIYFVVDFAAPSIFFIIAIIRVRICYTYIFVVYSYPRDDIFSACGTLFFLFLIHSCFPCQKIDCKEEYTKRHLKCSPITNGCLSASKMLYCRTILDGCWQKLTKMCLYTRDRLSTIKIVQLNFWCCFINTTETHCTLYLYTNTHQPRQDENIIFFMNRIWIAEQTDEWWKKIQKKKKLFADFCFVLFYIEIETVS